MQSGTLSHLRDALIQPGADVPLAPFDSPPQPRLLFGPGTLTRLGELARALGGSRVLLVTDPGIERAGHPQRAAESLRSANIDVTVFNEVEENPTERHVQAAVEQARRQRIDMFVPVGGGSSMDCAKGANFLLTNGGRMADYQGFGKATRPMLPGIGVPTTAGTGSEAQSFALIIDESTHMKMACGDRKVAFRAAILDPEVTLSQPAKVTAITGIDALSHALESYVTTRRNLVSGLYARQAWRLLEANLPLVLREPANMEARGAMQLGANLAGAAIENSMLGACRACANPLTAHYGITHGIAIGLMLPHVIRFNAPVAAGLYAELAHDAGLVNGDYGAAAEAIARHIAEVVKSAGLPTTLGECGVSPGILPVLADEATQQWTGKFNPRSAGYNEFLGLYQQAL